MKHMHTYLGLTVLACLAPLFALHAIEVVAGPTTSGVVPRGMALILPICTDGYLRSSDGKTFQCKQFRDCGNDMFLTIKNGRMICRAVGVNTPPTNEELADCRQNGKSYGSGQIWTVDHSNSTKITNKTTYSCYDGSITVIGNESDNDD